MSILIKGMEMPTDNTVLLRIYPQNDGVLYVEQLDIDDDILDKYWAVSVADVVERKHGEWYDRGSLSCRCSNCGCKSTKEYSFCPNCGADMRGRKDERTD